MGTWWGTVWEVVLWGLDAEGREETRLIAGAIPSPGPRGSWRESGDLGCLR